MKKSNKFILIIFALVVTFALFIGETYYTIAILKKVTLNFDKLTSIETTNPNDAKTDYDISQTREWLNNEYSEENYEELRGAFDAVMKEVTKDQREKATKGLIVLFERYPEITPEEKIDIEKAITDDWYFASLIIYSCNIDKYNDVSFESIYELSHTKKGQYKIMQDCLNALIDIQSGRGSFDNSELYEMEYSEENYKKIKTMYDAAIKIASQEGKDTIEDSAKKIFKINPEKAPADGFNEKLYSEDEWYFNSMLLITFQFYYSDTPLKDIKSFDEIYSLSKTKEGQFEILKEILKISHQRDK